MTSKDTTISIATRGSALALAQANLVLAQCRAAFPKLSYELKIIKTTGDKLQTASLAQEGKALPKGLFTKELEVALLKHKADLAVHSLKDLPTDLPHGLKLGAVGKRADVRDVLIYRGDSAGAAASGRGFKPHLRIKELPAGAVIATSSTRRSAQLLERRPDLQVIPIRGNVPTRLKKVAEQSDMDAIVLAAAGLERLGYKIDPDGTLAGSADVVEHGATINLAKGLLATRLDLEEMLPCVGQAAIGIEIREGDARACSVCEGLNDRQTRQGVMAERAFLKAMGGGCQL